MHSARFMIAALTASALAGFGTPASAQVSASSQGSTAIEAPAASAEVIQNVISQSNIVVSVVANPAPSFGTGAAALADSAPAQQLQFSTSTADLGSASSIVLTQDVVSVTVGAPVGGQSLGQASTAPAGTIVVLCQYN